MAFNEEQCGTLQIFVRQNSMQRALGGCIIYAPNIICSAWVSMGTVAICQYWSSHLECAHYLKSSATLSVQDQPPFIYSCTLLTSRARIAGGNARRGGSRAGGRAPRGGAQRNATDLDADLDAYMAE